MQLASLEQRIPQVARVLRIDPELVTEVTCETRAGNHELGAVKIDVHQPEWPQFVEALETVASD